MSEIRSTLESLCEKYPMVKGVTLESLQMPIDESLGEFIDEIKAYKDVIISSVDEGFQPQFSFIITDKGSVIVFFIDAENFLCVYLNDMMPNKQLAQRMYDDFQQPLLKAIQSNG